MPNMWVMRPADAVETVAAWELALNRRTGPTSILTTRQGLPHLAASSKEGVARGGYVVRDGSDVVLIATGSEVALAIAAAEQLEGTGVSARVVSLPCWELFNTQDGTYQADVLGDNIPRVSIEAGSTFGWGELVGDGLKIGIDTFGASAPADELARQFGFTPEAVAGAVQQYIATVG